MQNMYITRDGKEIQLTEDEIRKAHYIFEDNIRENELIRYKERTRDTLNEARNEWTDCEGVEISDKIIDHLAYSIRKAVEEFDNDEEWCFDTDIIYGGFYDFYHDVVDNIL